MEKKLYRNDHDKMLAGVCSGIAEYLRIEVTIVRIVVILLTLLLVLSPVIAYLILWIVLPVNPSRMNNFNSFYNQGNNPYGMPNDANNFNNASNTDYNKWNTPNFDFSKTNINPESFKTKDSKGRTIAGAVLLVLGCIFLARELEVVPYWFNISRLWPLILVLIGVSFLFKSKKDKEWEDFKSANDPNKAYNMPPASEQPTSTSEKTEDNSEESKTV